MPVSNGLFILLKKLYNCPKGDFMDKKTFTKISYGVYIIGTRDNQRLCGCTANSSMQITSEPASIAISINHNNYTNKCIKDCGEFSINILSTESNPLLIGTFGFKSSKDTDKFSGFEYEIKDGLPVLKDICGYILCKVVQSVETQTHTIFIGEVKDAQTLNENIPMTYSYYHNVIKGTSPKNAPTYIEA